MLSSVTATQVRALIVETTPVDRLGRLLPLLEPTNPTLWLRNGDGLAGIGAALRLDFSGPGRMAEAAATWRAVVEGATVTDPLGMPGTGLIAFGAFSFSPTSDVPSVLIVPEVILGHRDGVTWITRVRVASGSDSAADRTAGSATDSAAVGGVRSPLGSLPIAKEGSEYRISLLPGSMTGAAYRHAVSAALDRIRSHDLSKVVLARDLVGHLPRGSDLRRVLADLTLGYPDCWTFAVDGLLGASPETLVRVAGRKVSARVLAGTVSRGADADADRRSAAALSASRKDRDEHEFALRSALAALRPHSADLAASEEPFALKLPNLWHLASDIHGTLDDGSSSLDLLDGLHPTAAVAGTPTREAMTLIEELEPFDRGRYSGPVGWVGADGEGEWAVALRCAQVQPNGDITAYAGAGILDGSDPDREFAETQLKFRPIVEAFG